jgi:cysteinyl-tRNA synthetase
VTVNVDQYDKNHPSDFTLFKRSTLNELKRGIFYKTDWGNSRPGWHLECPTMAMKHLGETFDIHTGDMNLIFPHHENECAIAEALTGKPLARFWIHNAPVLINGKMMSERSGKVVTLRKLLQRGYSGRQIRYFLLTCHYRKPLHYSIENLNAFCKALHRIDTFVEKLLMIKPEKDDQVLQPLIADITRTFEATMDDDLNTPQSLAVLFDMIKKINPILENHSLGKTDVEQLLAVLRKIDHVLGILDLQKCPDVS